jgi:hypothetical protein
MSEPLTTRVHALNDLLQGEIAATETYVQALEKFRGRPEEKELARLRDEHVDAANQLKRLVLAHERKPATSSGAWGSFAKSVEGMSKVFGAAAALKALEEGEQYGDGLYARALTSKDVGSDARTLLNDVLMPRQGEHMKALQRLRAAA